MELSDANRLKQLEAENAKLKRLVTDATQDDATPTVDLALAV